MIRFGVVKSTGQGEQVTIEVCDRNPFNGKVDYYSITEMQKAVTHALELSDDRLQELNIRMLTAYEFEKYCPVEQWAKIHDILEVLAGRVDPATILHRWQSAVEETQDLERIRAEAALKIDKLDEQSCGCYVGLDNLVHFCDLHQDSCTENT